MTPDEIRALPDRHLDALAHRMILKIPGAPLRYCADDTAAFALADTLIQEGTEMVEIEYLFLSKTWRATIGTGMARHASRARAITEACVLAKMPMEAEK